jgi:DNA invertase Pin-like site-specific DNA recombinase/REP element-mobilizing transposase RayT
MSDSRRPAVGYIRMSTDQQQDSPARQRQDIEALAGRQGFRIIRWYEDHGQTGTESSKRREFQKLLGDAKAGTFQAVLLSEQSRMSREDIFDAMQHWRRFRDAGVSIITCQRGELKFDNLGGVITAIVDQYGAREESIRLADRVVSGKRLAFKKGQRQAAGLLGYDREILDGTGEVVRRVPCGKKFVKPHNWASRLVPALDQKLVAAVRFMFESVASGRSYGRIAKELNRADIIEAGVLAKLRTYLADERNQRIIRSELTKRARKVKSNVAGLEKSLAEVRSKIERGTENLALANPADVPGVSRLLGQWRDDEARIKEQLQQARGEGTPTPEVLEIMTRLDQAANLTCERERTMPQSLAQLYVHLVFSTKDRHPFLADADLREELHSYLGGARNHLGCPVLRVGGIADHVHVLCRLGRSITVADLVKELKRESSKWFKTRSPTLSDFHWQSGYGAFSVSPGHVEALTGYTENQEEHHRNEGFQDEFRRLLKKYGLQWDERYVWD